MSARPDPRDMRNRLIVLANARDDAEAKGLPAGASHKFHFQVLAAADDGRATLHALIEELVPALLTYRHEGRDLRAVLHTLVDCVEPPPLELLAPAAKRGTDR